MNEMLSIENVISEAKKRGIDFGKGDPYNRLRYYTKIGWLPHMTRRKDVTGNIRGHYEHWAVERLVNIETMKTQGLSNEDISKKLKISNKLRTLIALVLSKEARTQIITAISLILLVLIFSNELGIIRLGKFKDTQAILQSNNSPKQVIDSGTSFVPKNQKRIFVTTSSIKSTYKVYVTFTQDYSPATRFWVSEIKDQEGFSFELDAPVFNNTEFYWWSTN